LESKCAIAAAAAAAMREAIAVIAVPINSSVSGFKPSSFAKVSNIQLTPRRFSCWKIQKQSRNWNWN